MEISAEPRPVGGFRFAGVSAGLKTVAGRKDLALLVADRSALAAGAFTTNQVKAAPVVVAGRHLAAGRLRAVVANSGSANCFTGGAGLRLAQQSCRLVGKLVSCPAAQVAPCSTGVIGHPYPWERYSAGVREAVERLSREGLAEFAQAIMTTDTVPKIASTSLRMGGCEVAVAGVAKGAGMIEPMMATLLCFIVTDAALPAALPRKVLKAALPRSLNAITVDGDMSTNDTVILLASGAAGNAAPTAREAGAFIEAVEAVTASLARQLVADGEGATKLVEVRVSGARSAAEAQRVARKIANSPLVKTAFFGADPNVGRITAAAGASGVKFDQNRLRLKVGGVRIAARGTILTAALQAAAERMRKRQFEVDLDLGQGKAECSILTCDLSHDYVTINADYTT